MFVIHRGDRYGIRLKDPESASRREFTGLHWFPVKESYRVVAKFVPYQEPKMITIPNILGETEQDTSPGYVVFTLDGQSLRLDPVVEDDQLFFIFHDLTSGKGTYPAGRFLYTDLPKNGEVVMDFNQSQNPRLVRLRLMRQPARFLPKQKSPAGPDRSGRTELRPSCSSRIGN